MSEVLKTTASSRLHFGLLRFASEAGPSYGGLGMMIDRPRLVVKLRPADVWSATGPFSDRALQLARQVLAACPSTSLLAVDIEICEAPLPHSGLGSGTQLGLVIAAGIRRLCQAPELPLDELVVLAQRGARSAVGSYGFQQGGLIWEAGRQPGETLGRLKECVAMPNDWRVVLITMPHTEGLSGAQELDAFVRLPPVPTVVTSELIQLAEREILPAVKGQDFSAFSEAIHRYGALAGECFAPIQGGPFATAQIAAGVQRLRELGVAGVGQSSWGPTIFAFVPDELTAQQLLKRAASLDEFTEAKLSYTQANNCGAQFETISQPAVAD